MKSLLAPAKVAASAAQGGGDGAGGNGVTALEIAEAEESAVAEDAAEEVEEEVEYEGEFGESGLMALEGRLGGRGDVIGQAKKDRACEKSGILKLSLNMVPTEKIGALAAVFVFCSDFEPAGAFG